MNTIKTGQLETVSTLLKPIGQNRYQVQRSHLRAMLDLLTANQYFFSVSFYTRRERKNPDGSIRPAGSLRHMVCKRKPNILPTKDWTSKNGTLKYNPLAKELYQVYTTEGANGDDGTGNHWGMICMRSAFEFKIMGEEIDVIEVVN